MSGTFREWVEGSKVTEKHLSGLVRGFSDTVVEGLVVTDAGGLTIDISAGKALITGYEQRFSAVSGQSLAANFIVGVYAVGNETFAYQSVAPASEVFPPGGVPSVPGYVLIAIVKTGAASIDWVWNNPFSRGGHVSEASFQVGQGLADKSILRGQPRVKTGQAASIAATSWGTLMFRPAAGTIRGILKFVSFELLNANDLVAVMIDDEYSVSESASRWYRDINLFDGAWPSVPDDFMSSTVNDHSGMFKKVTTVIDSKVIETYWTRGQFQERFRVQYYNSTGSPAFPLYSVGWEELMPAIMGGG